MPMKIITNLALLIFALFILNFYNVAIGQQTKSSEENNIKQIWNGSKIKKYRRVIKKNGLFPICSRCIGFFLHKSQYK